MSNLKLTNSLSRKKEVFNPINLKKFLYMPVDQQFMINHMLETQEA